MSHRQKRTGAMVRMAEDLVSKAAPKGPFDLKALVPI